MLLQLCYLFILTVFFLGLHVSRSDENGGPVTFSKYEELESSFAEKVDFNFSNHIILKRKQLYPESCMILVYSTPAKEYISDGRHH